MTEKSGLWSDTGAQSPLVNTNFSKRQILDLSKLKKFADDNFRFYENGRKFFKQVDNTVGKEEIARQSNFSFSHSVSKRLVL